MTLREFLADANKAVANLVALEAAAVAVGLLSSEQAGIVTGVLGAASSVIVYFTKNTAPKKGEHEA